MSRISKVLIAIILAILTAMTLPAQVFAAGTDEKYISEVQIGVGKSASEAEESLKDYEILKDDSGNYVDLNKNAGATGTSALDPFGRLSAGVNIKVIQKIIRIKFYLM